VYKLPIRYLKRLYKWLGKAYHKGLIMHLLHGFCEEVRSFQLFKWKILDIPLYRTQGIPVHHKRGSGWFKMFVKINFYYWEGR
jgi:hypothetical protein